MKKIVLSTILVICMFLGFGRLQIAIALDQENNPEKKEAVENQPEGDAENDDEEAAPLVLVDRKALGEFYVEIEKVAIKYNRDIKAITESPDMKEIIERRKAEVYFYSLLSEMSHDAYEGFLEKATTLTEKVTKAPKMTSNLEAEVQTFLVGFETLFPFFPEVDLNIESTVINLNILVWQRVKEDPSYESIEPSLNRPALVRLFWAEHFEKIKMQAESLMAGLKKRGKVTSEVAGEVFVLTSRINPIISPHSSDRTPEEMMAIVTVNQLTGLFEGMLEKEVKNAEQNQKEEKKEGSSEEQK